MFNNGLHESLEEMKEEVKEGKGERKGRKRKYEDYQFKLENTWDTESRAMSLFMLFFIKVLEIFRN